MKEQFLSVSLGGPVFGDLQEPQLTDDRLINDLSRPPFFITVHLFIVIFANDAKPNRQIVVSSCSFQLKATLVTQMEKADEAVGGRDVVELGGRVGGLEGRNDSGKHSGLGRIFFWRRRLSRLV